VLNNIGIYSPFLYCFNLAPEVTWLANGEVIKPSSYFLPQILPNGEARLTIASAYQEDAGQYTIKAVNEAGEATATALLNVRSKSSNLV
jgi:hypothetical protein